MLDTVKLARYFMRMCEVKPESPDKTVTGLQEIINHDLFINGGDDLKHKIMYELSTYKYMDEISYPFENYFGLDLQPWLEGKRVLDLGCLVGGRSVAWYEKYRINNIIGIDVNQAYVDASNSFAKSKSVLGEFKVAKAESLPFQTNSFDAIMSYDVFEHVQDVRKALNECHRVLKVGGKLLVVFPSYYQPNEHHLSLVTKFPGIQLIFSGKTLVKAYFDIISERGDDAKWYQRDNADLEFWEKGNTLNGITYKVFKSYINKDNWEIVNDIKYPIGYIGRISNNFKIVKVFSYLLFPFLFLPFIREVVMHRIVFVLEKK